MTMKIKLLSIIRIVVVITMLLSIEASVRWAFAGSENLGGITLTEIVPKIITPNDDFKNDKVFFKFDPPLTGVPFDSDIFDINGARVGSLNLDLSDSALSWNGRNGSGEAVPSGIYVYQIKIGKNSASGTVVVSR